MQDDGTMLDEAVQYDVGRHNRPVYRRAVSSCPYCEDRRFAVHQAESELWFECLGCHKMALLVWSMQLWWYEPVEDEVFVLGFVGSF